MSKFQFRKRVKLAPGLSLNVSKRVWVYPRGLKEKQEADARVASGKKFTITCVKGKLSKKVTAVKPVCPAGFRVKK